MQVRCPQCQTAIELACDENLSGIKCPSCGSSFSLLSTEETLPHEGSTKTIGHFELVAQVGIGSVVQDGGPGITVGINPDNNLGGCDKDVLIPIVVDDLTGQGIISFEFTVTFDETVLISADGINITGDIDFTGWSVAHNAATPGQISVAGFGPTALSGSGVLLNLLFHTANDDGATSPLNFTNFLFNAGTPLALTNDGSITLQCCVCGDADGNGLVQAFDASLTLQHVLGVITLENPECVDVDGNGLIQAFDAALILQCVLGLTPPVPTCCSELPVSNQGNYLGKVQFDIELEEIRHQPDQTVAVLKLTGINNTERVNAIQFDMKLPNDETNIELFELPEEYLSRINRIENNIYKIGIVNPYGIDASEIKLALRSKIDMSGELIKFSDIYINSELQKDISTLLSGIVIPEEYSIGAFPNPFNPSTLINYNIPESGLVTLRVYDVIGREVASLVNENKGEGSYNVTYEASNLQSGIYIYQLKVNSFIETKKMILMK